jgi:carbonic anhydrase
MIDITYRFEARDTPARPHPSDSDAAVRRLCEGNRAFAALFKAAAGDAARAGTVVPVDARDVGLGAGAQAAPKQHPFAAILGCADARVPIELIFNEGPNDLFVLRVAGNGLGTEVLGSLNYAIDHLGNSLRLIVVLGHSGCGALTTAVDVFLDPAKYLPLATKHALRGVVDRFLVVVDAASRHLLAAFGPDVASHPKYRQALVEASIATNAALAAYSIEQELGATDRKKLRAVYGVYLLETRQVWAPGPADTEEPRLAAPPEDFKQFKEFGAAIIRSARFQSLLASASR